MFCFAGIVENALQGYNTALFAYGQTGSGKTHSMMGPDGLFSADSDERGLIPRICSELLLRADAVNLAEGGDAGKIKLEISYLEIWCESVRDLLHGRLVCVDCSPCNACFVSVLFCI